MAVVLSAEDDSYFKRSSGSLRRSHSNTQFGSSTNLFAAQNSTPLSSSTPSPHQSTTQPEAFDVSDSSSVSSSPRTIHAESVDLSYPYTPVTTFSIASDDYEEAIIDDESMQATFLHPSYQSHQKFFAQPSYIGEDLLSPPDGLGPLTSPEYPESIDAVKPGTPEHAEHAEDDTAVIKQPTRQVDYLSHDWREEDIWSSWRYVVSRRGEFDNSARLENASWRTWMKSKNNLKTISPETLNWLKDCDVTWLYGPLQIGATKKPTQTEPSSHVLSKSESFTNLNKKPCLKKRSMSELMLQRSISTASLLKQATAAVRAQETIASARPALSRAHTDFSPFAARRSSQETTTTAEVSVESSGISSPSVGRRHIHFNEQVEQCIAVDVRGDEDDDFEPEVFTQDSDSDDGFMMKKTKTKKRRPTKARRSGKSSTPDARIIAMLPSTTLKYREDTPEPQETAMKHSTGIVHSPLGSPGSSQETLRPSKESAHFHLGDDDDEMEEAILNMRSDSLDSIVSREHRPSTSGSSSKDSDGMRRTESGMLMPLEDGKAAPVGEGIFGRVIETVNTARDIAHVIWNVGWRK